MAGMKFTVLGGRGFVGSHVVQHLERQGHTVDVPSRDLADLTNKDLGHVIYAIGLTGDFRKRPFETVDAHVCLLAKLLQTCQFESWLYLSSTRVYAALDLEKSANEESPLLVRPGMDSLYNLSKMMGESLCLACPNPSIRVVRVSNVYGAGISTDTFLGSVIDDLRQHAHVTVNESPDSGKDYVAVDDVSTLLETISLRGEERLYNIASGRLVTHKELFGKITKLTGFTASFPSNSLTRTFPVVDISRVSAEFGFRPKNLLDTLGLLLASSGVHYNPGDDL